MKAARERVSVIVNFSPTNLEEIVYLVLATCQAWEGAFTQRGSLS